MIWIDVLCLWIGRITFVVAGCVAFLWMMGWTVSQVCKGSPHLKRAIEITDVVMALTQRAEKVRDQ